MLKDCWVFQHQKPDCQSQKPPRSGFYWLWISMDGTWNCVKHCIVHCVCMKCAATKNCNNIKHKIMIQNQNQNAIKCSTHCALCCFSLTCFDSDSEPRFQRFAKCRGLYSLLWVVVIHLHSHLNLTSVSCNAHWCTNLSAISLLIGTCTDVRWRKTRQKAKDLLQVKSWKVLKSNKKEWKVLKSPSIM